MYAAIGFVAQVIDGALGMGFGVISAAVLGATGVSPATVSASVHAAKSVTTAAAGLSNVFYRNVEWRLFIRLAIAGVIGGIIGAYFLAKADGEMVRPFVAVYLAIMGGLILYRAITGVRPQVSVNAVTPIGFAGGTLDAIGGGGWGPITVTTLLGRGGEPRFVIGSVNLAEFFVSIAVAGTFIGLGAVAQTDVIFGLIAGGLIAAPFAGYTVRIAPARPLMGAVGALVISLNAYTIVTALDLLT
ncbi:MAG: TSUP family transporter [Alphaproteobacteria bacterium]|nr:TSUP family transporter [Alphaproteobacteria bacterium]